MKGNMTTVVIGAGPYGLSIAAHLKAHNIPMQIFAKPMKFWEKMPIEQNRAFESSVPPLYFAGSIAGFTFGPICRFVAGSDAAAHQIS
jgi:hypothetical protein